MPMKAARSRGSSSTGRRPAIMSRRGSASACWSRSRARGRSSSTSACNGIEGIVAAFDVTVAAMAAGEITPDEALSISKVLERRRHAIEAKALQAERGAAAAAVEAPAEETPAPADAPDLHPTCNNSSNEAAAVAAPAEEAPAQAS